MVKQIHIMEFHKRSYRTYEEWKRTRVLRLLSISDGSYRTYEEWKPELSNLIKKEGKVLTVPMRNGNSKRLAQAKACGYSSYRTYEEWKHGWGDFVMDDFNFVLTVPMRNGNSLR